MATVSVKIIGTFLCLLVPSMLVYMIWSLNSNKQRWEGKGKHGKGKKGVCVKCPNYSCPRLELFIYPSLVLFVSFGVCVKKKRPVMPSELWKDKRINEILTQTHQQCKKIYPSNRFNDKKCFFRKLKIFFFVLAVHVHARVCSYMDPTLMRSL